MGKRFLRLLINKYFITSVLFVVWIVFFDSNSIISRMKTHRKLNELRREKRFYLDEIRRDSVQTYRLINDSLALERVAREKYRMKKDNEDLFLVIDTTGDQHQR